MTKPSTAAPRAPSPGARQQQKAATRQALVDAARKVLARRGFAGTTTREIASEAGVAVGTFFVHFPDLDALVDVLLDEHIAGALETAMRTAAKKGGLVKRLVHVSKVLFESYDVEPELSRAYLSGSLFRKPGNRILTSRLELFQHWVSQQIEEAVARGEVPEIDRELAFNSFFSLYFGALVGGLGGWLPPKRRLSLLEAALRRLFLQENVS